MYDTVVASIEWPDDLDEHKFQDGETTINRDGVRSTRLWLNPTDEYKPRVTYYKKGGLFDTGRLKVEFSIPKMAGNLLYNIAPLTRDNVLYLVHDYVSETFSTTFPRLDDWQASRIDYALNFDVGDSMREYIAMLRNTTIGGMNRSDYPHGVQWKSKQTNSRTIKFYDKTRELGRGDQRQVLRFEVSNHKRMIPYMCKAWYGCNRTVGELLQPGRALYCMAMAWQKLGLGGEANAALDESLLLTMRRDYGRAAAGAYYAWHCITQYGNSAHTTYDLMSSNSYYTWQRRLRECGYLSESMYSLSPLHLPTHTINMNEFVEAGQNLGSSPRLQQKDKEKILWENLSKHLGVRPEAKPSKYLLRRVYGAA